MLNKRLRTLEEKIKPDKVYISLIAHNEIEGKELGENFTDAELEQVQRKYRELHQGKEVKFILVRYVDKWR